MGGTWHLPKKRVCASWKVICHVTFSVALLTSLPISHSLRSTLSVLKTACPLQKTQHTVQPLLRHLRTQLTQCSQNMPTGGFRRRPAAGVIYDSTHCIKYKSAI